MRSLVTLLCLSLAPLVAQQPGSIAGTVRDATTGKPIPGAHIRAHGPELGWRDAMSDRSGRYLFDNLPPGSYQVFAFGYNYPGPLRLPQTGPRVTVEPGGAVQDVDVALKPGGSISGRVLSEDGVPLEGCYARVTIRGWPTSRSSGSPHARTDDDGAFYFGSLAPDNYLVAAFCLDSLNGEHLLGSTTHSSFHPPVAAWRKTYYPASPTPEGATPILVAAGSARTIEIRLPRTALHSVRGTAAAPPPEGSSCAGWLVPADQDGSDPLGRLSNSCDGGRFVVSRVPTGAYRIELIVMDRATQKEIAFGAEPIEVGETEPPPVTIHLQPTVTLNGRVIAPSSLADESAGRPTTIGGSFSDAAGGGPRPASGSVTLFQARSGQVVRQISEAIQSADGSFRFTGLRPGDYEVAASRNPGAEFLDSIEFGGQPVAGQVIPVTPGPDKPLVLRLSNRFAKLKLEWPAAPAVPIRRWSVVALPRPDSPMLGPVHLGTYLPGEPSRLITHKPGRYAFLALEGSLFSHTEDRRLLNLLSRHVPVTEVFAGREQTVPVRCFTVDEVQRLVADYLRETNP